MQREPSQGTQNLGVSGRREKLPSTEKLPRRTRMRRRWSVKGCILIFVGILLAILFIAGLTLNWLASLRDSHPYQAIQSNSTAASALTPTATPCPSLATDSNINIKQIPEGNALVVNVEDVAFQVVALFPTRGDLDCWAYEKDLLSMATHDGPALVVLEEDPNPSQSTDPLAGPARSDGTFALIIGKGGKVDATVMTISDAKLKISQYPDRTKVIEQANYPITTKDKKKPA